MSQLVRLEEKDTTQSAHCAMVMILIQQIPSQQISISFSFRSLTNKRQCHLSTLFCPSNSGPCHRPLLCQDLSHLFCASGCGTAWEIVPLGIRSTKFETTGLHAVLFSPLHYALSQVFVEGADLCGTALTHCSFSELLKNPQRSV